MPDNSYWQAPLGDATLSSHPCFYKNLYIETSTPFLRRLRVFSSHRVLNHDVRFYMYQRCKHGQAVMVECCEDLIYSFAYYLFDFSTDFVRLVQTF